MAAYPIPPAATMDSTTPSCLQPALVKILLDNHRNSKGEAAFFFSKDWEVPFTLALGLGRSPLWKEIRKAIQSIGLKRQYSKSLHTQLNMVSLRISYAGGCSVEFKWSRGFSHF